MQHDHTLSPLTLMLNEIRLMSPDLQKAIENTFRKRVIKKGAILLHEGDVCKSLWFLADGVLRSYHNIKNKEVTSRIMYSGHIVISPGSFFTQTSSTESIEALTDCTLAILSFDDLQGIYEKFPEFNFHARIITEQYFYKQEQRLYMLRKHDAVAKYNYFMEHYAQYLKDIPQKYIASFLNIAPETLSRVRGKLGR